jgi:hypothetical protein
MGAFPFSSRRIFLTAFLLWASVLIPSLAVHGQKLNKYYTSSIIEGGTLYFVFPFGDFQEATTKTPLIFDISYISSRDSATLNFSYFHSSALPASSLILKSADIVVTCPARKLFIDLENHQKWHHRYSTTVRMSDLSRFFQSAIPPEIIVTTDDGPLLYRIGKGRWNKQGRIVSSIVQMIQANS